MTAASKGIGERSNSRLRPHAVCLSLALACAACVSVPELEPLTYAVDDAELRTAADQRALEHAAAALADDPALHLQIIGHADEDNTDDYNRELSRRRAERARERIVALDPELGPRITTAARSEWDAEDSGEDARAKARNRRIELRFHYPRQCEPSFDSAFLACEWARLPEPPPPVASEPELAERAPPAKPPTTLPPPRLRQDFVGPYVFGIGGYAIASSEFIRHAGRWGVGAGYLFGFGSEFRVSVGLDFDHLIDAGFVFPQPASCAPFCADIDRSRMRLMPELRVGGVRGGFWGWVRVSGGLLLQHREPRRAEADVPGGDPVVIEPGFWAPGATVGVGPGIAVTLTRHLLLMFDGMLSYAVAPRIHAGSVGGAVVVDVGAGLGWIF